MVNKENIEALKILAVASDLNDEFKNIIREVIKDEEKLEIIENHFDLELERVINRRFGSNLITQDTCFIFLSSKEHKNMAVSDIITEEEFNKLKEMI